MATVYVAEDVKHGRPVALKLLRPELAAALGTDRFLQEIAIAARLQHPNVLPLYDSGEADSLLYYVMPVVDGESLRARLDRERHIALKDAIQIITDVAGALSYAHAHDVVHRDVKPENILLSSGRAIVADFGIARAISAAGGDRITNTGFTVGTRAYMSPEQAAGQAPLDGRADEYSLACVLHEMLAGELPVLDAAAGLRTVRDTIPATLQRVLAKALAPAPADRFPTVQQFADALSEAGLATETGTSARVRSLRRVALGALALTVFVGGVWAFSRRTAPSGTASVGTRRMIVVLPFDNLGLLSDAYFAEGLTDEITNRIAENSGLAVISHASATHYSFGRMTIKEIARELGVQYVLAGSIRTDRRADQSGAVRVTPELTRVSDGQVVWSGRYDAALAPGQIVRVQSVIATGVAEALNVRLLHPEEPAGAAGLTDNLQAYDAYLRGNAFARKGFLVEEGTRHAVEMYERAVELDPKFALAYAKLAQSRSMLYYFFDRASRQLDLASQAVDRAVALGPDLPEAWIARGYFYYWGHLDYERALEQFRAARDRQPNNSQLLWVIGSVERRQGKWDRALASYQQALRLDPRSHVLAFEVGGSLHFMRRFAEAGTYYDRAMALAPDWVPAVASKALLYRALGERDSARSVMHEAAHRFDLTHQVVPVLLGDASYRRLFAILDTEYQDALERFSLRTAAVDSGSYYVAKAELAGRRGQPDRARAYRDSARAVWEPRARAQPTQPAPHVELGMACAALGRSSDAAREAATVAAMLPISQDALRGAFWASELARLYVAVGDHDAAIAQLKALLAIPAPISVAELSIDPAFNPLQGDPRFQALLAGR
jgi:serine/threonine-protein kinase